MPSDSRPQPRLWPWLARAICLLCLAGMFFGLWHWCSRKGWSHDEVENVHAGWLIHKGQLPYVDFFHHKPPFYWQFVSLYYRFAGDDLGVMLWARHFMLFTFLLAVAFTFLIGRELFDEWTGWAAAGLLASNEVIHFPAIEPREQGWMLAFLLAGLWIFLRSWRRSFRWHQGLLAGALLGAAYAIHPRAGYPILAVALVTAFDCQFTCGWKTARERWFALSVFSAAFLALVSIPYLLYGLSFHRLLYDVSLTVADVDRFSPAMGLANFYLHTYATLPLAILGLAFCLLAVWKSARLRTAAFAALCFFAMVNAQVLSNPRPFVQAFYSAGPFAALLGASTVHGLFRRFPSSAACAVAALLAGGFYFSQLRPPFWTAPNDYVVSESRARFLLKVIPPDERYLGMESHPIFRLDGSRYWFDMNHVMRSLQLLDPTFRHDWVAELEQTRPFLLGEDVLGKADHDPEQIPTLRAFVFGHYLKVPNAPFLVRNDAPEVPPP